MSWISNDPHVQQEAVQAGGSLNYTDLFSICFCHQAMETWRHHIISLGLSFLICEKRTLICALYGCLWLKQGNDYRASIAGYLGNAFAATTECADRWPGRGGRVSYQNHFSTPAGFPVAHWSLQDPGETGLWDPRLLLVRA